MHVPAIDNGDLATVAELVVVTGNRHAAEGGTAEVKLDPAFGAAGTLVGNNNGNSPSRADGLVQTLNLVTGPTAFTSFEQNWTHCPNSCL